MQNSRALSQKVFKAAWILKHRRKVRRSFSKWARLYGVEPAPHSSLAHSYRLRSGKAPLETEEMKARFTEFCRLYGVEPARQHRMVISKLVQIVHDNGTGIPSELRDKLFNPFFTAKPVTGLGLSISHDTIVKQHGRVIFSAAT